MYSIVQNIGQFWAGRVFPIQDTAAPDAVEALEGDHNVADGGAEPARAPNSGTPKNFEGVDLADAYTPPPHVSTGHVYSNAYRKSMKRSCDKETAKVDAQKASRLFQSLGVVSPELCGKFAAGPRAKRARRAEPANAPEAGADAGANAGDDAGANAPEVGADAPGA